MAMLNNQRVYVLLFIYIYIYIYIYLFMDGKNKLLGLGFAYDSPNKFSHFPVAQIGEYPLVN